MHKIPSSVDLVVGIPGSGMLAGSLIALSLNTLATDLPGFIQNRTLRHGFTRNTKTGNMEPRQAWREALNNARPLVFPTQTAGNLVTDHPEIFRNEIEEWLDKHNIRYKSLHMPGNADASENHPVTPSGTFKAQVYQSYPKSPLFIESSDDVARRITFLTGRKVLSYCIQEMLTPEYLRAMEAKQMRSYPSRVLRKVRQLAFKDSLIYRMPVPVEDPAKT